MQIEIWSDIVCPWCYLGKHRFERALEGFAHRDDVDVVYRSFELDPDADREDAEPTVELLARKYKMTADEAVTAQRQMEARAAVDGVVFDLDGQMSGNTRDAHRLVHLARAHDLEAELIERLGRAYFTEHRSVFDHASLADLAVEIGLDRDDAVRVLSTAAYDADVAIEEETANALGVTGVPFFVIDRRYAISGAQSSGTILETLNAAWADATAG